MRKTFPSFTFSKKQIFKLLPALLMMLAIFLFSARPSDNMPMSLFDRIFYKGGHLIGYAMLAISYWRVFGFRGNRRWVVWLLAVLYAITDEFHQSFVSGRHPAVLDVLVFDNIGALVSLWLAGMIMKQRQQIPAGLVVEPDTLRPKS